ncbi:MAG: hypothetical protein JSS61_06010 [Verrucomicrobia bacterium]|nr:hypothetical protein [Verrucomicrobiota bacterium]
MPVSLSISSTPLVKVEIQEKTYALEMDLGSRGELSLNKKYLDELRKQSSGTYVSRDISGIAYETPSYRVSSVSIESLVFQNVVVKEDSDAFTENNTFWMDESISTDIFQDKTGSIGRALLGNRNLLLDLGKPIIYIANDLPKLKQLGYDLNHFSKTPFEMTRAGAVIRIRTDDGVFRFAIDTGCTVSFVRPSIQLPLESKPNKCGLPYVKSQLFEIGGVDFGSKDLYVFEITPILIEIDGILGVDFMKNCIIYLDHSVKLAYFFQITRPNPHS